MRFRFVLLVFLIALAIGACDAQPPALVVLVVTATPTDTPEADAETPTITTAPTITAGVTSEVTLTLSPEPSASATLAPTATPDIFPTPTVGEIQVAEQLFQNGRMFWVQPTRQLWVLIVRSEGRGTWTIYPDMFQDGVDPELDPSLLPPEGLIQPERGFGKLWRENQDVREGLGWATTPEFGYVSRYEYHPGGTIDSQGQYVPAPGYHILYSLYQEQFRFNEVDGTWQLGGG
jgi:hypothetical protein